MSSRKKIVFAINNLGMGGAENMLIEQVTHIDRNRFEPYVVTLLPNQTVNVSSKLPADVPYIAFTFSSIFDFRSLCALYSFFKREKIEVVITNLFDTNLLGRVAAVLARVPIILSYEHNVYKDKKRWQIIADIILARFTKKILVCSNEVLEFTSKQEGLPKSKFKLNLNAIPFRLGKVKKNRNEILHKYNLPTNFTYVVTAGSLTPQKDHARLIDAAHQIKRRGITGFKILIFGRGVLKDELTRQIQSLEMTDEVLLMGFGPVEEIMAVSDIFTLPSLWEGLSIALLQAMDAQCPIVATRVSGTNEVLENEVSGLLVTPGEVSELAAAFQRLLGDVKLRHSLGEKAKERVKDFSIEKNIKVIEKLAFPE